MTGSASVAGTGKVHSPWLDAARALASLIVCFAHLRAFFLVDFNAAGSGAIGQAFYLVTGLHHQGVMVFFVLSGFFVGGALLREAKAAGCADNVDWLKYSVTRLSRLWLVLIPALLLTLVWDRLGMALAGTGPYQGQYFGILSSGPSAAQPASHSLLNFLGSGLIDRARR